MLIEKKDVVLSFDVADGKSVVGLFKDHGEVLIPPHSISHSFSAFELLKNQVLSFSDKRSLIVIMEATSIYHYPVERYFRSLGFDVLVVNPLLIKNYCPTLRKTKTDPIDCAHIADTYFHVDLVNNNLSRTDTYSQLTILHRQYQGLEETLVRYKNRYRQIISLCFPEMKVCFKNSALFSIPALSLMKEFPHVDLIKEKRVDAIANVMSLAAGKKLSSHRKKAEELKSYAKDSYPGVASDSFYCLDLKQLAQLILDLQKNLAILKEELIKKAKETEEYPLLLSVYGIGEFTAAQLIAELGCITRFDSVKELTAYCGLDPAIRKSGKSVDKKLHISKRGKRYARKIVFIICMGIVKASGRGMSSHPVFVYYQKKKKEGKHYYECLVACSTKLLRILFALVKSKTLFIMKQE